MRRPTLSPQPSTVGRSRRALNERRCRRLVETARPLATEDLAWETAAELPMAEPVIESLVYMRDVEGFTDRDLVGLTAHRSTLGDGLIHTFLDVWRTEEGSHARALDAFLVRYGDGQNVAIPPRQLPPAAVAPWHERVLAQIGGPLGQVVTAAHMVWGAANELLTLNGYRLLATRCRHPMLSELLARIAAQEARHFSFYFLQAEWRLAASHLARVLLRRVLRKAWTPVGVGAGYKSPEQFGRVLAYLGSDTAVVERMDRRFAGLPGFGGLRIYRDAVNVSARRRAELRSAPWLPDRGPRGREERTRRPVASAP